MDNKILLDRVRGALYGFAIGDAMGATTEFMTKERIAAEFGTLKEIIGGGWLKLEAGCITDDTQMSMCIMSALMKVGTSDLGLFKRECMENFVNWYYSLPPDVGGQCSRGIRYYMATKQFIKPDNTALGNGSLMRALPCALICDEEANVAQGVITHNAKYCSVAIRSYTKCITRLIYDEDKRCVFTAELLLQPTGCVINTLNNAYYWANKDTFEECIIGAVNHGGDSDTIGAIAGSLSGARFGISTIPERWLKTLNKDVTEALDVFANWVVKNHSRKN